MREIKIDFDTPGLPQRLDVVENDAQSRFFKAVLYKDGKAYTAPSGATYSIMYRGFGPQNEGWYDTINDGAGKRAACSVSGNVVTCEIARQALRVPGHMTVVLCVTNAKGYMLKSWPIMANVRNDDYEDTAEVEMYFNLSGIAGNYLTQLEKAMANAEKIGRDLTATADQTKQAIEEKANAALASIPEDYTELSESVGQLKEDLGSVIYQYVNISEKDNLVPKKLYIPIGAKFRIETLNGENFGKTATLRLLDIDKNEIDYYSIFENTSHRDMINNLSKDIYYVKLNGDQGINPFKTVSFIPSTLFGRVEKLESNVFNEMDSILLSKDYLRNGSISNAKNTEVVASKLIFTKAKSIKVVTDRPNKSGFKYVYSYASSSGICFDINNNLPFRKNFIDYSEPLNYSDEYETWNDGDIYGVQIAIGEYNPTTEIFNPLRVSDFEGYKIYVYDTTGLKNSLRLDLIENEKGYPSFYDSYILDRIENIKFKDILIGNSGDSFTFITDLHNQNNYYSPFLAKKIYDNTSVKKIVYGGDYINEPSSKEEALSLLSNRRNKCIVKDDVIFLRGNHDTNPYGTGQLTLGEFYSIFDKYIEKHINTNKNTYFYNDNESQKIRYIFVDSGVDGSISDVQKNWIRTNTENLDVEWTLVIFMHHGIYTDVKDDRTNIKVYASLTSVKEVLANVTCKIACIICGHSHIDLSDTSGKYPIICTTCDAHGVQASSMSSDNRDVNTINEQAFDVFHIDTANKKVYVTRIGGGENNVIESGNYSLNDREFSYS